MWKAGFIVMAFVMTGWSQTVGVPNSYPEVIRDGDRIVFLDPCENYLKDLRDLVQWSKYQGSIPTPIKENKRCKADITELLPDFVKEQLGVHPKHMGPECYNVVEQALGLANGMHHTRGPSRLALWMRSPYCRQRSANEHPAPGDVIFVDQHFEKFYDESYGEHGSFSEDNGKIPEDGFRKIDTYSAHVAIFVNDRLVLEKAGGSMKSSMQFSSLAAVKETWNNIETESSELRNYRASYRFFVCEPLQPVLNSRLPESPAQGRLEAFMDQVKSIEIQMHAIYIGTNLDVTLDQWKNLQDKARKISFEVEQYVKENYGITHAYNSYVPDRNRWVSLKWDRMIDRSEDITGKRLPETGVKLPRDYKIGYEEVGPVVPAWMSLKEGVEGIAYLLWMNLYFSNLGGWQPDNFDKL